MKAQPNPIDVVELAYRLEGSNEEWLTEVASAVQPLLDGGCGLLAYHYDFTKPPRAWLESGIYWGRARDELTSLVSMIAEYKRGEMNTMHMLPTPLEMLGEACRQVAMQDLRQDPVFKDWLDKLGARDVFALRTIEPCGKGISICAPQRDERLIDRRTKSLWAKVSAHLAAGRRLREANHAPESFDAVLTPSGRVEHVEGDIKTKAAREHLRAAVLRQEKARGKTRRQDPQGATEMWTALVGGQWSLVDHFERGGRRYIVARRNEQGCPDPRALGARERDVVQLAALGKSNKLIAYELGIAESTVASHLSSAMRKLGVKSRVELLHFLMKLPS